MANINDRGTDQYISLGPWGGSDADGNDAWSIKFPDAISHIVIRHGWCIDFVAFGSGENAVTGFGGTGGDQDEVTFDLSKEYLIGISGTFGLYESATTIRSLCFYTNLNTYGPYGRETGTAFTIPIESGKVIGFYGRAGKYINSIGVYVQLSNDFGPDQYISLGPWGGSSDGDNKWSIKFPNGISRIVIHHGWCIDFVAFGSGENAITGFGGTGGDDKDEVTFDLSKEHLIGISGTFGLYESATTIRSLCFYTNLNTYGPYGREIGTAFSIPIKNGKVIGFHGRAGKYVSSIGVYVLPISQ